MADNKPALFPITAFIVSYHYARSDGLCVTRVTVYDLFIAAPPSSPPRRCIHRSAEMRFTPRWVVHHPPPPPSRRTHSNPFSRAYPTRSPRYRPTTHDDGVTTPGLSPAVSPVRRRRRKYATNISVRPWKWSRSWNGPYVICERDYLLPDNFSTHYFSADTRHWRTRIIIAAVLADSVLRPLKPNV